MSSKISRKGSGSTKRNYPLFEKAQKEPKVKKKKNSAETIKIWTWNVAGLRACVKKGGHQRIRDSGADIVSLQETKCSEFPDEINALDEYQYKKLLVSDKKGYAGVALLSKERPIKVEVGIGNADFDDQARYIQAEFPEFFFIDVYVPNAGRGLVNLHKRGRFDELFLNKLAALDEKKPVVIAGDMNVAHQEIERNAFTHLLDAGFVDVWRTRNPETTGAYTYWSYIGRRFADNIGWRLDYFVVSQQLSENVTECDILKDIRCSDHCPVSMVLNI